jgi:pimeloyl-ACP methyl ester carboxylesterase
MASPETAPLVLNARAADSEVHTDEVCFIVQNEGDPEPSHVYGVRYYVGEPGPRTKVVLLVHGSSVTHAFWDVRPDVSVARRLGEAGYLVVAYDRLGFGRSAYARPRGAGYPLTLSSQRGMLHEIVAQLKSGSYTFSTDGTCSASRGATVGVASPTVILIGHSAGGAIVSGYPGTYHDVAATVQVAFNNQRRSPAAALHAAQTIGPQLATGNDYAVLFPTPEDCKRTLLYMPGVLASLLPHFCEPQNFVPTPAGEFAGIPVAVMENRAAIQRVEPDLPVLLAWMDHDFFFPESDETQYWVTHCGCDLTSWTQPDSGHAFVAHRSTAAFVAEIRTWLASKGLGAN